MRIERRKQIIILNIIDFVEMEMMVVVIIKRRQWIIILKLFRNGADGVIGIYGEEGEEPTVQRKIILVSL